LLVDVGKERAIYSLLDGSPLEIVHHGDATTLYGEQPLTRPIPAPPPREPPTQPPGRAPAVREPRN
jgi:alpha,alpha-trehalose phosphorylase